ncbi:MAG: TrmB family transcriptional regulator, partial [Candidatus Kariarchaeaceae archaeon]
ELTSSLLQTGYFESNTEARVLAYLVATPQKVSVKEICNDTNIHNSNVYPAIKNLEKKGLIFRNTAERPVVYITRNPEGIREYLENAFNVQIEEKKELIEKIYQLLLAFWKEDDIDKEHFSHIFKGEAIRNEIKKLQRQTQQRIIYIIGPKFYPFLSEILETVEELLQRDLQVWIAIPFTEKFLQVFAKVYHNKNPKLKIKQSIWLNQRYHNSYIISDNEVLLNITHRNIGDDAILNNDVEIVSHVQEKWNDPRCVRSISSFEIQSDGDRDIEIEI